MQIHSGTEYFDSCAIGLHSLNSSAAASSGTLYSSNSHRREMMSLRLLFLVEGKGLE